MTAVPEKNLKKKSKIERTNDRFEFLGTLDMAGFL
jgi:hypothetical protein